MRIGIVGVGAMGERHCRVCADLPQINLVGVADLDERLGREVAARYGTAYYPNYRRLLPGLDAVVVATPTDSHRAIAGICLEQNLHVLVEKPIANTVEQAQQLVRIAEERGLVLQVGHIERFNPAYVELKRMSEGAKLVGIVIRRLSPFDASNVEIDVIRDLMIHDLDLAADLVGQNVREIGAWGCALNSPGMDYGVATLSFEDDTVATLFASRIAEQKVRAAEIVAEGAYFEADLLNKSVLVHRQALPQYLGAKYRQESLIERIHVPAFEPLMLELQHFADCVRHGLPSLVSGSDGVRALRLAEAVINEASRDSRGCCSL